MFNQEISNFDTSGVTDMREMFRNSTSFNKDLGSWDFSSITQMDGFMTGKTDANYSSANYDSLLSALVLGGQSNVTLGMGTIKYSSSGVAE